MFRFSNQLLFPTLKLLSTKHPINNPANNLYQLDWKHVEAVKEKKWLETRLCSPSNETFQGSIPEKYRSWVDEMQFALPNSLIEEIRHCSLRAVEEWDRRKPGIKWEPIPTRSPGVAYIQTAFNLLADCLYDPETNNYSRDERKSLVPYALSYRFWCHQTKVDNLIFYTGVNDLKLNLGDFFKVLTDNGSLIYNDFIDSLEKHAQSIRNSKKVEKAFSNEITPGTLRDFLSNSKASVYVDDTMIIVAEIGKIKLLKPHLSRSMGMKLSAELGGINDAKIALDLIQSNSPVSFDLKDESGSARVTGAWIANITGTPPPTISINIKEITMKPFKERFPVEQYDGEQVKIIDQKKIKNNSNFSE